MWNFNYLNRIIYVKYCYKVHVIVVWFSRSWSFVSLTMCGLMNLMSTRATQQDGNVSIMPTNNFLSSSNVIFFFWFAKENKCAIRRVQFVVYYDVREHRRSNGTA